MKHKKKAFLFFLILIIIETYYLHYYQVNRVNLNHMVSTEDNYYVDKSNNVVNPHTFKYIINAGKKICENENLLVIALVTISPSNFEHIKTIRETWSNPLHFKFIKTVFLFGLSLNDTINRILNEESEKYKDIIQEDFIDTYDNLTLKTIMGFKWVSQHCSNAKFMLKVDDDVVVNTHYLVDFLLRLVVEGKDKKQYIGSFLKNVPIISDPSNKWHIHKYEYNKTHYPPYNRGPSYLISTDLAFPFYNCSFYIKKFRFEDVYTGMLASQFDVNIIDLGESFVFGNSIETILKLDKRKTMFIMLHNLNWFKQIWNFIKF